MLAVDPGLTRCGLGVVDGRLGGRLTMVAVGVLRTPSGDPISLLALAVPMTILYFISYLVGLLFQRRTRRREAVS